MVRGAGEFSKTPSFKERYGLSAACIAGGGLYKGVAKVLGMDLIWVKGATGLADTDLKAKFLAAKQALRKYSFVFLHIKATDTFSHYGDFEGKKKFIEKIDKNLRSLFTLLDNKHLTGQALKNTLIVITADHSTCCDVKNHCCEPIPILIYGNGKDEAEKFSEKTCKFGKLGKIKQTNLMKKLLEGFIHS